MFTVFKRDGVGYMTGVAGGVAMYDLTMRLTCAELALMLEDENWAIALAKDLVTRTQAYAARLVSPALQPDRGGSQRLASAQLHAGEQQE